jgi:hypothetical protein
MVPAEYCRYGRVNSDIRRILYEGSRPGLWIGCLSKIWSEQRTPALAVVHRVESRANHFIGMEYVYLCRGWRRELGRSKVDAARRVMLAIPVHVFHGGRRINHEQCFFSVVWRRNAASERQCLIRRRKKKMLAQVP